MRIAVPLVFLLAACGVPAHMQAGGRFDGARALEDVVHQVGLGARHPGGPGHAAVQAWIADQLKAAGWVPVSEAFEYRGVRLRNIVGVRPESSGPTVLLGAHYDTRRLADRDSVSPDKPVPGANDGASGVAVLLEVGRRLGEGATACDLRLVFFDGEDNGGLDGWEWAVGSRHFAATMDLEPAAVVIVDMVGDRDLDLPLERTSTPELAAEVWAAAAAAGLTAFRAEPGPSVLDDHTPFLERGWPAVDIIDLTYPYWHTTADTPDKVAAESLAQVGEALLAWLDTRC